MGAQQGNVRVVEEALQQKDGLVPAKLAQPDGFLWFQQREAIGVPQRGVDPFDPMPVGIGFHHCPDAGRRRGAAGDSQVVG